MMDERGWGWNTSEIRQAQLAEWIAQQPADHSFSAEAFYAALPDQAMNSWEVAHGDLKLLEERSLIRLSVAMGGIRAMHIHHTQGARDLAEELRERRANRRMRRQACRDAIMDWLYSLDAVRELNPAILDNMLADTRRGMWFAEPFTIDDLDAAAAWLKRNGLIEGVMIGEREGPVHAWLTDDGVTCVDEFDSYAGRYLEAQQRAPGSGPTVNISGGNSGAFQVAGDHAHQVQHNGASAEHLRELITGLAEMVRAVVPDASGILEQEEKALAAAGDGAVDRSIVQRFGDWVLSTVQAGATAVIVPAVASAITAMMLEAGRLTGHIG